MSTLIERQRDWELARSMAELWREARLTATGNPKQREIARMLVVLEYVREFDYKRREKK